jgi:prepilin-type N-terminal cleavage/methylation domain-containing protein
MQMRKDAGFSLIELSIALLVIGLFVSVGVQFVNKELAQKAFDDTINRSQTIKAAIEAYYFDNGYYPWPANPTLTEGNPNYGKQDPARPVTAAPTETVQGAVPFVDLKIGIKDTLDGWGNKFTYAVSRSQTPFGSPAPMPEDGVITVTALDLNTGTQGEVPDVHWVLVSHGRLGLGAYTTAGVRIPCPAAAAGIERDNCNDDAHFYMSGEADMSAEYRSLVAGTGYIDDYTLYRDTVFVRYWINPLNAPGGENNAVNVVGALGIKTLTPGQKPILNPDGTTSWEASGVDFDVEGAARANFVGPGAGEEKGLAKSMRYCADEGGDCFEAEKIAGVGMQDCVLLGGAGVTQKAAMAGITMNSAKCIGTMVNLTPQDCPPGTNYMKGISATGDPICD